MSQLCEIVYFNEASIGCMEPTIEAVESYADIYLERALNNEYKVGRVEIKYNDSVVAYKEFKKKKGKIVPGEWTAQTI